MTSICRENIDIADAGQQPVFKSVRAAGHWQGGMATHLAVRDFHFHSDEPVAIGGKDSAPTPMEIVAGAINACATVVIATVARELDIEIRDIRTESAARIDVRGFRGTADVSPHYQDYRLEIHVETDAPPNLLEELCAQTEKRCPAVNLVRDSGVAVDVIWSFHRDGGRAQ